MMQKPMIHFLNSKLFKKVTLIAGIAFFLGTLFIALDPRPFIKFGYPGVFLYNLFGTGNLLIPVVAKNFNIILLAFISALGNTFNDSISYMIGKYADDLVNKHKHTVWIQRNLHKYGTYFLFVFSLLPFPYDFIGAVVGYEHYPYTKFMISCLLGKFVRYLLIGWGIVRFT